jgi:hypothetical protein
MGHQPPVSLGLTYPQEAYVRRAEARHMGKEGEEEQMRVPKRNNTSKDGGRCPVRTRPM